MLSRIGRFTFAVLLTGAAAFGGAATAAPRSFEFDVKWSMFPELTLATGRFLLSDESGRYLMGLEARAKLAAPPVDWRGYLAAEGERSRQGRKPVRFERSSIRPTQKMVVVVSWDAEGKPVTAVSQTPLTAAINRERVDPDSVRDVVDPLTFLAQVLDQVEDTNGASCDLTARTWDGHRLAEIETRTIELVKAARIDCQIVYNRIEGLRKDTPWKVEEKSTMRVVRFVKEGGNWLPKWIRIDATVIGMRTTFTTTIRSLD